jgi:hypothetical protein
MGELEKQIGKEQYADTEAVYLRIEPEVRIHLQCRKTDVHPVQ